MAIIYQTAEVVTNVPQRAECDKCGADITLLGTREIQTNPEDALEVRIRGWYGGFIDLGLDEPDPTILICGECARRLCSEWFPEVLTEREGL